MQNLYKNVMLNKSSQSLKAAQKLLYDHAVYATQSVHCSYYAVFQFMKYFLAHNSRDPLSYEQQNRLSSKNKLSHEVILEEVKNRLNLRPSELKKVTESIRDLKQARMRADYSTETFSEDEALNRKAQAESLISKLKNQVG